MELAGAVVAVTGAASGLGAATARYLAASGATVFCLDRDADRGTAVADDAGGDFLVTDVTDDASVAAAFSRIADRAGRLDALVNCAGIATAERILGRDGPHRLESFRRTLDINLTGSFNTLRHAVDIMSQNDADTDGCRGAVVNTASVAAFEGQKGQAAYAASKGGVAAMTLPAARDLASLGIRVNAIAPGLFLTPMLEGLGEAVIAELAADVPFPRRLGRPEEFGRMVGVILTSAYLNGTVIRLDGALRMR